MFRKLRDKIKESNEVSNSEDHRTRTKLETFLMLVLVVFLMVALVAIIRLGMHILWPYF